MVYTVLRVLITGACKPAQGAMRREGNMVRVRLPKMVVLSRSSPCNMSEGKKDDSGTTAAVAGSGPLPPEIADSGTVTQSEEKIDDSTSTEFADSGTASSTTTIGYPIADDSGTVIKMEKGGSFDQQTCVVMWYELSCANDGKVTNFHELADLMVRNMEEYVTTGDVASGKLPFAVQFCSPGWLPWVEKDRLIKLREFFCQMTRDDIFWAISAWKRSTKAIASKDDEGRKQLKNPLGPKDLNILTGIQAVRSWHGAMLCARCCAWAGVPTCSGAEPHNGLAPSF